MNSQLRLGILALALIFFASGYANIRDSHAFKPKDSSSSDAESTQPKEVNWRRFGFGIMLLFACVMVVIYYVATLNLNI